MNKPVRLFGFILLCLMALYAFGPASARPAVAQSDAPLVMVLTFDGPVSSSMLEYVTRGLRLAEQRGAELVILQLNTPGGEVGLMNSIERTILSSPVPVVVYVAPRGAMAASAGTIITLAGHAAAMAPETIIGAASPVGPQGEDLEETMQAKLKAALQADARSLAQRRGEEAVKLADAMIESAKAATVQEALDANLVDFMATDIPDLLRQLDGFQVQLGSGARDLHTANAQVEYVQPTFLEQILIVLTNPNIVFLLLQIGLLAILVEITTPGGWVSGFIGVICLALGTYGLGILNVNWFGLVFLVTAFVLFLLDIKAATHGALTAAAVGSLIVGALVLFNSSSVPSFQHVSVPLVVLTSLGTGAIFFAVVVFALRAQSIPVITGRERMVGRTGRVVGEMKRTGQVQLGGEQWTAELVEGQAPLQHGERVEVVAVKGVRLVVRKVEKQQPES
ncbi:MAG: nodulation protein NfeD [Chloroflexota bacterium]